MSSSDVVHTDARGVLIRVLGEAYDQETWAGNNLAGALEGMSPDEAAWVAPGAKHGAAAVVVHCAYWKAVTRKRLLALERVEFPLPGEDWFEIDFPLSAARWAEYRAMLDDAHRGLIAAAGACDRDFSFGAQAEPGEWVRSLIGMALHDAYHAGQIALMRAQYRRMKAE